jgi:hypothetical protein
MGKRFQERSLAAAADRVTRLNGDMINLEERSSSEFILWFERGAGPALPIRFEYRARAFLHLAFEHDPSLTEPEMIPLLDQENP